MPGDIVDHIGAAAVGETVDLAPGFTYRLLQCVSGTVRAGPLETRRGGIDGDHFTCATQPHVLRDELTQNAEPDDDHHVAQHVLRTPDTILDDARQPEPGRVFFRDGIRYFER